MTTALVRWEDRPQVHDEPLIRMAVESGAAEVFWTSGEAGRRAYVVTDHGEWVVTWWR